MDALHQALRGAQHTVPRSVPVLHAMLVVGGGGALGSAVLAEALVAGRFSRVMALVAEPLASGVRGFEPLPMAALSLHTVHATPPAPAAIIVFERQRNSNGRDDAFVQPAPQDLLPLARMLRTRGVQRLLVVVPHAPAMLPQALSHGLASLDEAAVAALGFEHLVFLRAAQSLRPERTGSRLQRFAAWWLAQLSWMVPQRQQPVRAATLARCVVQLARLLPGTPPGTQVIAPETLWLWGQAEGGFESGAASGLARALAPQPQAGAPP